LVFVRLDNLRIAGATNHTSNLLAIMRAASTIASASAAALLATTLGFSLVGAASWNLTDTIAPSDFESEFTWFTATDPTDGLVLYQSLDDAVAANLSLVSNDQFIMQVDTTEVQLAGRKSVRITSNKSYSDGVYV
jgi:hypothetical protein